MTLILKCTRRLGMSVVCLANLPHPRKLKKKGVVCNRLLRRVLLIFLQRFPAMARSLDAILSSIPD